MRGESAIRTVQKVSPLGFPHQGHSCFRLESLGKARKSCLLELLWSDVSSRPRVVLFGPSEGAKPPWRSLLGSQGHFTTTGESKDHVCDRAAFQPPSPRRVPSSTRVELNEPPRRVSP